MVAAAIGLLCLGRSDFNDIEAFRDDPFFQVPAGPAADSLEPTLRQRLNVLRNACGPILREESAMLLRKQARRPTPCHGQWVAWTWTFRPSTTATRRRRASPGPTRMDGYAPRSSPTWARRATRCIASCGRGNSIARAAHTHKIRRDP